MNTIRKIGIALMIISSLMFGFGSANEFLMVFYFLPIGLFFMIIGLLLIIFGKEQKMKTT